jgi:hypothetical protein
MIRTPSPRITLIIGGTLLLLTSALAASAETAPQNIDWRQRFDYWTVRCAQRFQPPTLDTETTLTFKNTHQESGILTAVSSNQVVLETAQGPREYPRTQLAREDRKRLFREDFARANALEQVLQEKQEYARQTVPPAPENIQTQARLLTGAQFAEYAGDLTGLLVNWTGTVSDIELNFFSEYQCLLDLSPSPDSSPPISASFIIPGSHALSINRRQHLGVFGIIKSVRLLAEQIQITLSDASIIIPPEKPSPANDETQDP